MDKNVERKSKDISNVQTPFMRSTTVLRTCEEEVPKDDLKRKLAFEEVWIHLFLHLTTFILPFITLFDFRYHFPP